MALNYVLSYDVGTTDVKTCLFSVGEKISLVASASGSYPLYVFEDGGAEQDGNDWWNAMKKSTAELLSNVDIDKSEISGISFCTQMQALILVDKDGNTVRRPMVYLDQRAKEEVKKGISYGLQIAGANIFKLIPSLIITGAVTSSVKDPVWKYKWVESHEKSNFDRAYKWFDVKDYLICRCTGEFKMTEDSAFSTLIYDTRKGHEGWSKKMCSMFDIKESLLPEIIKSTDIAGKLTASAAAELGLEEGTPVFGGGGDSSLIGVGAGAIKVGSTHIYAGTSGWVNTVVEKQMVDVDAMIAAIVGAISGRYNYFAEMETAGKCLNWVKNAFAEDIIGSDFSNLDSVLSAVPAGSNGLIFTPWLHGNRCPFEDPDSTGMYFGLKIDTTKEDMLKAVLEGVFYHLRWMLECQEKKLKIAEPIRFVGGVSLSKACCQMLSDITGKKIDVVSSPKNAGAVGAAAITAVGLGLIPDIDSVSDYIPAEYSYIPNDKKHAEYESYYNTFKKLYKTNKKLYKEIKQ